MQLSPQQIRHFRLRAQGLAGPRLTTPAAVVERLVGVQAQEEEAARLAFRQRSAGLTAADVDQARLAQRDVVYTWAMRSTLHFVTTADLGWLLDLLGPLFVRLGRRRRVRLGINGDVGRAAMKAIDVILAAEGALTREELGDRLAALCIPTAGQALYHMIARAGLEGILCIGAPKEGQPTYVRLADWVGLPADGEGERATVRLARRYLAGYGPAGPEDFAAWSGLPVREARAAFQTIKAGLVAAGGEGETLWLLPEHAAWLEQVALSGPVVHLLPGYDDYLLGYRNRDLIIAPEYARRLHLGGGLIRPALLVSGLVAGTWRLARRSGQTQLIVQPFERLDSDERTALEGEVVDVARFLEIDVEMVIESTERPVRSRRPGRSRHD